MNGFLRRIVLLLLATTATVSSVLAAGDTRPLNGHDLVCQVDWRWPGCRHGGYYPIRIRVLNKGPDRRLTFRFRPDGDLPTVERTVDLPQNGSQYFSLSVPMVGTGFDGWVDVLQGGRELSRMEIPVNLAQRESAFVRPAMLIVGPRSTDPSGFEGGVQQFVHGGLVAHGHGHFHGGYGGDEDHEILNPGDLPRNWIDYTGVDMISLPLAFFENPDDERRDVIDAILRWVDTGGTLVVHQLEEMPADSELLRRALRLDDRTVVSAEWRNLLPTLLNDEVLLPGLAGDARFDDTSDLATRFLLEWRLREDGESLDEVVQQVTEVEEVDGRLRQAFVQLERRSRQWRGHWGTNWCGEGTIPFVRDVGLGRVVAVTGNAFVGSPYDWAKLLDTSARRHDIIGDNAVNLVWPDRHGVQPRSMANDFERFLIPGVRSVPVVSFLVLITLFTIVIGPLNYFLLWRKGRLNLLVLTIPLIAFGTSLTLFAYSTVSHGFSVRSRMRSVTLLDQGNNTRITTSRVALFAGMAPSSGLDYEATTAVYPIWPGQDSFRGAHVDWSEKQAFDSGWLRSRTRTQFLVVQHEPARIHVNVLDPEGDTLPVDNNLGTENVVEFLLVRGSDGRYYGASDVPVGKRVHLPRASDDDLRTLAELLRRNPMEAYHSSGFGGGFGNDYATYEEEEYAAHARYEGNAMERLVGRSIAVADRNRDLPANSYVAVLSENPEVDAGLENTRTEAGFHLLVGFHRPPSASSPAHALEDH